MKRIYGDYTDCILVNRSSVSIAIRIYASFVGLFLLHGAGECAMGYVLHSLASSDDETEGVGGNASI
jgi:hypothetical protein